MRRRNELGITVLELVMAMGIFAIMVVPLGALVYRSQVARRTSQDALYSQQDGAVVLSRFTADVRSATRMTSPLAEEGSVTMRVPTSLTEAVYVTWRVADGRLQRGESPSEGVVPGSWHDVIDPNLFTVEGGRFAYFTVNNGTPTSNDEARRLELGSLALKSKSTGGTLHPPAVSAVMREPATARALSVTAPWTTWGDDRNWHDAVHVEFPFRNDSGHDLAIGSFAATWDDHAAGGYIEAVDFRADNRSDWGNGKPKYHSGADPVLLDRPLSVGARQTATIHFLFKAERPLESFTMTLYEATDTSHARPYVLKVK